MAYSRRHQPMALRSCQQRRAIAVQSAFLSAGQRCTAASRVVVHKKVYKEFVDAFVARAKAIRVGDGLAPGTQMGPSVSAGQLETVQKYVEIGRGEGATLACGGKALSTSAFAKGFFHEAIPMHAAVKIKAGEYGRAIRLLLERGGAFQTRHERTLIVNSEQQRTLEAAGLVEANGVKEGAGKGER